MPQQPGTTPVIQRSLNRRTFLMGTGLGALALSGLSACGGGSGATTPTSSPTGVGGVEPVQLGKATAGPIYPKPYKGPTASAIAPFGNPDKVFRVVVPVDTSGTGDWNTNAFSKWFEQRTGVKVQYEAVIAKNPDGATDLTKVNAILASGDLPDAFLGIDLSNDVVSLYGSQGVFVPLDDYIVTYGPEQRRRAEQYPEWRELSIAADGKQYQMVGMNDCLHCKTQSSRTFINSAYVKKVGAELPTTTEEFRQLLQLFKAKDPSGTGKMVPYSGSVKYSIDAFVMNAFTYNPGASNFWIYVDNDTPAFAANSDAWREGLRFLRTLFDDGTITAESFTRNADDYLRVGNRKQLGVAATNVWSVFIDMDPEDDAPWRDYVGLAPLKGPDGVQYATHNWYQGPQSKMVITSACSNPEVLVQWADAQMELEATMRAYNGDPANWSWAPKGDKAIDKRQAIWETSTYPAPAGQAWNQASIMYRSTDMRLSQSAANDALGLEGSLRAIGESYSAFAEPKEMQIPPIIFDEAGAAQKADIAATISSYVTQSTAKFATGRLDINDDAAWAAYRSDLEAQGLPALLDLYKQAFDKRPR